MRMKHLARLITLCLLLSLITLLGWQVTRAQTGGEYYFTESGHWVRGPFFSAFMNTENAELLYGLPITEAYQDEMTGNYVQYFEKARMELRLDASGGASIYLTDIGKYLYPKVKGTLLVEESGYCREIPPSELRVCHEFLAFYEENGGVEQFGLPVSGMLSIDDLIVQYFSKARLEWRPDLPQPLRVKVSDLGRQYFNEVKENPKRLLPDTNNITDKTQFVTGLKVRAYPRIAVTGLETDQSVFVIVQDQKSAFVEMATVDISVVYPSGREERFISTQPETNEEGVATVNFPVSAEGTGIVVVRVNATYTTSSGETLVGKTLTSFRIWR